MRWAGTGGHMLAFSCGRRSGARLRVAIVGRRESCRKGVLLLGRVLRSGLWLLLLLLSLWR